jgi:hypothetical protein
MTMRNFSRPVVVAVAAVLLSLALPAGAVTKVGTTSMQVLKMQMDVRGIAMGNAMVASGMDAQSVWANPGALTELSGSQAVLAQINMPAKVQLNNVVIARKLDDVQAVSVHAINLFTDDMIERTWDRPEGTGRKFNASDLVIGATYARRLTDRFSLGANVRYLRSSLSDATYNGLAVDLGTLYKTSLRTLQLGMAIQNLGPNVKYSGNYQDYRNSVVNGGNLVTADFTSASLPAMFRLGVAFEFFQMCGIATTRLTPCWYPVR